MQTALSRIWTWVFMSISYDNNLQQERHISTCTYVGSKQKSPVPDWFLVVSYLLYLDLNQK